MKNNMTENDWYELVHSNAPLDDKTISFLIENFEVFTEILDSSTTANEIHTIIALNNHYFSIYYTEFLKSNHTIKYETSTFFELDCNPSLEKEFFIN